MVTYTITGFLILLGTICLLLVFLLVKENRKRDSRTHIGSHDVPPEELEKYRREFQNDIDNNATEMLRHLIRYRRLVGADGLQSLVESYIEESSMPVRKDVIEVFVKLYGESVPDENMLDDMLENLSDIEKDNPQCHLLIDEIRQKSPAHFELLYLLKELFDIAGTNIKKLKEPLNEILAKHSSTIPESVSKGGELAPTLSELFNFIEKLSQTLPDKRTKDKLSRRKALNKSLIETQNWVNSCGAFQRAEIAELPEGGLIRKLVDKLWGNINDFLEKSGGNPRQLKFNYELTSQSPSPKKRTIGKSGLGLIFLSAFFYMIAALIWFWSCCSTNGCNPEIAFANVVKIETSYGYGTGFFVRKNGLIVSNYHVVADENEIKVHVNRRREPQLEPRQLTAKVLAFDILNDVAILQVVNPGAFSDVPLGFVMTRKTAFKSGQKIHVFGNPEGISNVYTQGSIMKALDDLAFIDAKIGQGNSGGPVCNDKGVVIGITTAYVKLGGSNFDFGIIISTEKVWDLINQLK
jgi:S1-C subfamily serine protease